MGSGRQAAQKAVRYCEAGERHTAAADELIAIKEIQAADSEAGALEALGGGRACRCAGTRSLDRGVRCADAAGSVSPWHRKMHLQIHQMEWTMGLDSKANAVP